MIVVILILAVGVYRVIRLSCERARHRAEVEEIYREWNSQPGRSGGGSTAPERPIRCCVDGCPRTVVTGSLYCPLHQPGGLRQYIESLPGSGGHSEERQLDRDVDDLDVEGFYLENMDEFEDEDDAWDYLEDNPDEWDDY